jgi:hypothetical protein
MLRRAYDDPRRGLRALCLGVCLAAFAALAFARPAAAAGDGSAPSYRIFLTDGTALVSFGEFARANGRIVFTMPIGAPANPDVLQVVTLPDTVIDWDRTDRYADAVRHQHYASTRGEEDYAALTGAVARALGDMAFAPDSSAKLAIAADIRRQLLEWPASHLAYRSGDVRELTAMVEEAISDIRAGSGQRTFDLSLVAMIEPPAEALLPEPTVEDSIDLASAAARMTEGRRERLSLQESIVAVLDRRKAGLPRAWHSATRKALVSNLKREATLDLEYAALTAETLSSAAGFSRRADVAALERLAADVQKEDARLGYQRPEDMQTLLASLAVQMEQARAARLAIEQWERRKSTFGPYRKSIDASLGRFSDVVADVAAVRQMSGLDAKRLSKTDKRISAIEVGLIPLSPPADLRPAHDMLISSVRLMREAVRLWRGAAGSGEMNTARNASAAAAGALLLLDTARGRIDDYFRRPAAP